jgi:hypothetical protein
LLLPAAAAEISLCSRCRLLSSSACLCSTIVLEYTTDLKLLQDRTELAVMIADVYGSKCRVALKGWPAESAGCGDAQLHAEILASELFAGKDPTIIPPVAVSGNSTAGNFTTASTYGGPSLKGIHDSEAWQETPVAVRAVVMQRIAAWGLGHLQGPCRAQCRGE